MAESDRPGAVPGAPHLLAAAEDAARLGDERVASAGIDLFLSARSRLSDYQRVTTGRLLDRLVASIEGELRARLAPALREVAAADLIAGIAAARMPIAAPILARAQAFRDPELIAILLRRADEHRATMALRLAAGPEGGADASIFERWLRSGDSAIADAASALLIADSRRIGAAQEPLVVRADLPVALQHRLLWRIAAALRHHLVDVGDVPAADADRVLTAAVSGALAAVDAGDALAARAMRLAERLGDALDDAALLALIEEGHPTLAIAGLARRAGVAIEDAADMLLDAGGARAALLVRASDVAQGPAGALLMRIALALGQDGSAAAERIEALAALSIEQARAAIGKWRIDRDYRAAIARLDKGLNSGAGDAVAS